MAKKGKREIEKTLRMEVGYDLEDQDFQTFVETVNKVIETYGLMGWEITFVQGDNLSGKNAETLVDVEGRNATFCLAQTWTEEPTLKELKRAAFHEVTEALLLGRLRFLATNRYIQEREVDEEMHNLTRTLENILFHSEWDDQQEEEEDGQD